MPRKSKNAKATEDGLSEIPKEFLDQVIASSMAQAGIEAGSKKFKKPKNYLYGI